MRAAWGGFATRGARRCRLMAGIAHIVLQLVKPPLRTPCDPITMEKLSGAAPLNCMGRVTNQTATITSSQPTRPPKPHSGGSPASLCQNQGGRGAIDCPSNGGARSSSLAPKSFLITKTLCPPGSRPPDPQFSVAGNSNCRGKQPPTADSRFKIQEMQLMELTGWTGEEDPIRQPLKPDYRCR